jgi:uncharacterized protein (TIGR02145 family)
MRSGAYCDYNNDSSNAYVYGHLYNWYAASNLNIAPEGWHVPTIAEWTELIEYLGGSIQAGGKLKEAGFTHWQSPNTGADNETGFTALPSGARIGNDGQFNFQRYIAYLWARDENQVFEAQSVYLVWVSAGIDFWPDEKYQGFAIRCVRN